jgi:stage V sporulation protein T
VKATGIVRRIDGLGRIVIPKEIRKTMRIKEGDPLEIFIDTVVGNIVLKKYDESVATSVQDIINELLFKNDVVYGESIHLLQKAVEAVSYAEQKQKE